MDECLFIFIYLLLLNFNNNMSYYLVFYFVYFYTSIKKIIYLNITIIIKNYFH